MNYTQQRILEERIKEDYSNIAGMVIFKEGKTVYENYFNGCHPTDAHHIFSVTKSIISILIGIAIDKGFIKSVNQKVLNFFPNYVCKKGEKTIQLITLEHLLTMTAPYKYKSAPYTKYFTSEDWVKSSLDLLGGKKEPGTFRYTPLIGPDILSGILTYSTGQTVNDFATNYLFSPLGIERKPNIMFASKEEQLAFHKSKNTNGWVSDPKGVNTSGWGLTLTAQDMAKIGQLLLNDGIWENERILSSHWITQATKEHSKWEELNVSYGYLWWINKGVGYAAMGDCGNIIYVNTQLKLVVAIVSTFKPTAKDRIEMIHNYIEPIFKENTH